MMRRLFTAGAWIAVMALTAGCQTIVSTYDRFFGARPVQKPAELPELRPTVSPRILWQGTVGAAEKSILSPGVSGNVVYAVGSSGQLAGFEAASGRQAMRIDVGQRVSGGVGTGGALILVGTPKG